MLHFLWCLLECLPVVSDQNCVPCVLFLTASSTTTIVISGFLIPANTTFCKYQNIQGQCGRNSIFVSSHVVPSLICFNIKLYIFLSSLIRKHIVSIWSICDFFYFVEFFIPIIGEFFAAEDVVPAGEICGFIYVAEV